MYVHTHTHAYLILILTQALLADNKTLISVARMDGDGKCFSEDVPTRYRDANHTTYRK